MDDVVPGEKWAVFFGVVADGNDDIKFFVFEFGD
jgi:hypothetical protein